MTSLTQVTSSSVKRKRAAIDDVDADAALAQALQAEEYGDGESKPATLIGGQPRRHAVEDSDESMLSELSEAELSEDQGPSSKRAKPNGRTVLPTRRARNAAKETLTSFSRIAIDDSEGDSESTFSLSDSEDVDLADDDVPSTASATPAPEAGNTTTAPSSARRRHRRRPFAADAGRRAAWNERRIAGLNDRVSYYDEACLCLTKAM